VRYVALGGLLFSIDILLFFFWRQNINWNTSPITFKTIKLINTKCVGGPLGTQTNDAMLIETLGRKPRTLDSFGKARRR